MPFVGWCLMHGVSVVVVVCLFVVCWCKLLMDVAVCSLLFVVWCRMLFAADVVCCLLLLVDW